jgi:hypothetical protein
MLGDVHMNWKSEINPKLVSLVAFFQIFFDTSLFLPWYNITTTTPNIHIESQSGIDFFIARGLYPMLGLEILVHVLICYLLLTRKLWAAVLLRILGLSGIAFIIYPLIETSLWTSGSLEYGFNIGVVSLVLIALFGFITPIKIVFKMTKDIFGMYVVPVVDIKQKVVE